MKTRSDVRVNMHTVSILLLLVSLLLPVSSARADRSASRGQGDVNVSAVFTVNSLLDQPDDLTIPGTCHTAANTCTLRAASMQANRISGVGATIMLPAGVYTLSIPIVGTDGENYGDINLTPPTIGSPVITLTGAGPGKTIIDAGQLDRVLHVFYGRSAVISNLTLQNGYCSGPSFAGGGLANEGLLTMSNVVVSGNQCSLGGGIFNSGRMTLSNGVVTGNKATIRGGGIFNEGILTINSSTIGLNSAVSSGGGINNQDTLTVNASTIYGNTGLNGGGIISTSTLFVVNSTISENNAISTGAGIYNDAGNANVYNSSIVFNGADSDSDSVGDTGGVYNSDLKNAVFNMRNTLIAGNYVSNSPVYTDCTGTMNIYGFNLFGSVVGCTVNVVNGSWYWLNSIYLIGPLQKNGGPTLTHAPLYGSNAINATDQFSTCVGPDALPLPTDQRGLARVAGGSCDIGAVEGDVVPPAVVSITRLDANPSIAASLRFAVNFSESVSGVDPADFSLSVLGITGAAVTGVSGTGVSRIVTVATGTGFGSLRLNVIDNDSIQDGAGNPLAGAGLVNGNFLTGAKYTLDRNNRFTSSAAADGWILESGENTTAGGVINATTTLAAGDDAANKQYRSFLYFNTSGIPDNATIVKVTLRILKSGLVGTNPFSTHGALLADIQKGIFGTSASLQLGDFQVAATKIGAGSFAAVSAAPGWYQLVLAPVNFGFINKSGATSFRLRFNLDDNNDKNADFLKFYAGEATAANRPVLVVEYTLP